MQTVWSDAGSFLAKDYKAGAGENNPWNTFKMMMDEIMKSDATQPR
jgi:hypothetical protein